MNPTSPGSPPAPAPGWRSAARRLVALAPLLVVTLVALDGIFFFVHGKDPMMVVAAQVGRALR